MLGRFLTAPACLKGDAVSRGAVQMAKAPVVDLSRCVDCDACVEVCPGVFIRNEAGYIEVAEDGSHSEECIQEAVNCCPSDCISWEGSTG